MGFLTKTLSKPNVKNNAVYTLEDAELLSALGISDTASINNLGETVYFTCLKLLSESISKINIRVMCSDGDGDIEDFKHPLNYMLRRNINPYMTNINFWNTIEFQRNHYGNAFCYIEKDNKGGAKHLWILDPNCVNVLIDNEGIFKTKDKLFYRYTDPNNHKQYTYLHSDILHFKTSTSLNNGITGLAVKDALKMQLNTRLAAQAFLNKNYTNDNFGGKIIIQYTGDLDTKAKAVLAEEIASFKTKSSSIYIPVPVGVEVNPLAINLTDSQFAEINAASALEIASAFGIKPYQLGREGKYNNIELQQLDFFVNTSMQIFCQYEQELTRKLFSYSELSDKGYYADFNTDEILRGDFKSQVDTITKAVDKGLYTINEGRKMLKKPKLVNIGDIPMVNGSYTPLSLAEQGINYNKNATDNDKGGGEEKTDE